MGVEHSGGRMECWKGGIMEWWNVGRMEGERMLNERDESFYSNIEFCIVCTGQSSGVFAGT